jgi:TPP-dependent pyruvate/acetoin dehydrogenase alpha subunit
VREAVARARRGEGPSLIEARTYRLRGHWQADAASYRPAAEAEAWGAREPIGRFEERLLADGLATPDELRQVWGEAERRVEAAAAEAQAAPPAGQHGLGEEDVYA